MRRAFGLLSVAFLAAGCGSSTGTGTSSTPTSVSVRNPTAIARATASEQIPTGKQQPRAGTKTVPGKKPQLAQLNSLATPAPGPPAVAGGYGQLLSTLCSAFHARNASAVTAQLPRYEYNSGVRYGQLGDGDGQTGDTSILGTWLAGATVRCVLYTPSDAGHGTLLTSGWHQPGGWGLIELDTYGGRWKINDFTFGTYRELFAAMHTAGQVLQYRA